MSASLVGSEMCIRDSTFSLPVRSCPEASARSTRSAMHRIEVATDPVRSVSYTHLTLPTICSV
eukprot:12716018-Alexandrium_andersonii.AAC.1